MSASSSKTPSKHSHRSAHEENKSEGVNYQPERLASRPSRPQSESVSRHLSEDVRDMNSRETWRGGLPLINHDGDAAQRKTRAEANPGHYFQPNTPTPSQQQPVDRRTDDTQQKQARREAGPSLINRGSSAIPGYPIQQRIMPTASQPQSVGQRADDVRDVQSRESERGESRAISSGSEDTQRRKRRKRENDHSIAQNITPTAPRPQSVDQKTDDVRDAQRKEAGYKESSLTNRESGNRQKKAKARVNPDDSIPNETLTAKEPSITMLQGASNFQINNANFTAIGGNATIIRFGNDHFTDIQRDLIGDYIATLAAIPGIKDDVNKHILAQLITNLPRAEAVFNDYQTNKKSGPCFEGTRVALLREMADWVTSQDESRMYILSGLAGIGKSTVAYTIASRAADLNLLGASFFFSRDEADRNNAKKLFTTIAYQLCVYDERFSEAIGDALRIEPAATTKAPLEQLKVLILDPLRSIVKSRARPILIIVDALDECCDNDVRCVFTGLSRLVESLPPFKVILTTRPLPLFDRLLSTNPCTGHKLFRLQDIEDKIVDGDIRLYLRYKLSFEAVQELYPERRWHASDQEIDTLVHAAGRLFIIASTSVRYILDEWASDPATQMKELLRAWTQNRTILQDLDQFYTVILWNVVPANCDNHNIINRYQSVLGAIILVQSPLSVSTLSHLIGIDTADIHTVLYRLQSVILLDGDIPRVYHKTFPDYLMDEARCKDPKLQINPKISHKRIAMRCFAIANERLKYNILGLGTPARFMDNDEGLRNDGITDEQLLEKIPQHLRYACVYWVAHLTNIEDSDVMNGLDKFVNKHTLHWLEVLSIIGKLDTAHRAIRGVLELLKSKSSDLHQLLSDVLRFISKFYKIIKRSSLHVYYSALPFSPTDTLLYQRYIEEAAHGIFDIEGGLQKWDPLVAVLDEGDPIDLNINVVKFSLNSAMLVTYFNQYEGRIFTKQGKLTIWDVFTGAPISQLLGETFAISSDFSTIASSTGNIITYYNHDGSSTGATVTTSSKIKLLALSSESDRVAAMFQNHTGSLWESGTGKLITSLEGSIYEYQYKDKYDVALLQFSPSGTRFLYSLRNGIVKLWDGISGRLIADLRCGSDIELEFSADSSRIASLSRDFGLQLWNSETGGLIGTVINVSRYSDLQMAISPNGSLLATTYDDSKELTLWRENCDQFIRIDTLMESADSIAFSSESRLVISNYFSVKVYNIDTQTIFTLISRQSNGPLAFSPDGTRLARGALLFDVEAIYPSSSTSGPSFVTSIALSRDCSQLSCGFQDGLIELWRTSPKMRRIASYQEDGFMSKDMVFSPDGGLFASLSYNGTIRLWSGRGQRLIGTLDKLPWVKSVALSNSRLIEVSHIKIASRATLWDLDTLSLVHTFRNFYTGMCYASISDQGDLAAIKNEGYSVDLFHLENFTLIATFQFPHYFARAGTFLPDKSHLVGQTDEGQFLSINLVNKVSTDKPLLEHLAQLPNIPIWHGVPLSLCRPKNKLEQPYIAAIFSQDQSPVPVLWIPTDISVKEWAQGSSMIAIGCEDGRIILLQLRT